MSCDEQFKFIIGPSVRYLNILVWNFMNDGQSQNLIGYVSIPLTNLTNSEIGRKRRIFYLNSPNQSRYSTPWHLVLSTEMVIEVMANTLEGFHFGLSFSKNGTQFNFWNVRT